MEIKRKTRSSLMLFKRRSQLMQQEANIKIINKEQLFEIFKNDQIYYNILSSLMKLPKTNDKKNIEKNDKYAYIINRILENMKKKNLFFFFLNFYKIDVRNYFMKMISLINFILS